MGEDLASVGFLETWRRRWDVRLEHGLLLAWLYGGSDERGAESPEVVA